MESEAVGGNAFWIVGALYLPINSELPSLARARLVGAEKLAEALIVLRNLVSDVCTWQFEAKIPPPRPLRPYYPPRGERERERPPPASALAHL